MRLAAATVALALLGGGCSPIGYRGGWILTATGAVVGVAGAGIAASSDKETSHGTLAIGALPGIIILAVGLYFVIENDSPAEERAKAAHPLPWEDERHKQYLESVRQQREAAWQLTKEAQQAARDGNCARVIEIDANVKAMDAELYASTFITDVAIQRCVGTPPL
jgi:hypothetical protein